MSRSDRGGRLGTMRSHLPGLPHAVAALVLVGAAIAACDDPLPTAAPPPVDTAELERAAERVDAAADRLDGAAEQLEEVVALGRSESGAIFINADALRLLALLSQLQVELRIIDALLDPPRDIRPNRWPLEPEDGAALGFASTRLFWIHHQLSTFAASPPELPPIFQDEEHLALLAELQGELQIIGRSAYAAWNAHEAGEPSAPAIRPPRDAQTGIDQLIDAVGAVLATDRTGAAVISGATWNAVNALERLGWAVSGTCSAWNCQGGHSYPLDAHRRALAVYSVAEFRAASSESRGYSSDAFDGTRCGRSVEDGRFALGQVSYLWLQYASRFRDAGFDYPQDGGFILNPSRRSIVSPSSLYRQALLICTLQVALSAD